MLVAATCLALAFTSPPFIASTPADGYAFPVNVPAGSLASALRDLARQTGIELLFDGKLVEGMRAVPVRGRMTVEGALRALLAGTTLSARRSASGAWLIERGAPANTPPPTDLAEPEILVVGQRTQNVAIRRRENDVQPYQVATGEQIVAAHRDNLDQYFRSRTTSNAVALPPSLQDTGSTNSTIDLRGLGADGTLVLVDGRRMPGIPVGTGVNETPDSSFGMGQADVTAIPLYAIDRIETLTGTAGGIYGFGALGGVINIVLKRDYRGLDLHVTTGISARGDAKRLTLDGRLGFSPDGGRTDVMLDVSHSWSQPLLQGQRDYTTRGRLLNFQNAPEQVIHASLFGYYIGNAVGVADLFGDPLVLRPELGGTPLGSNLTYLPIGFTGTSGQLVDTLIRNAGQVGLLPTDGEQASELGSTPSTTSVIFNLRHRFGAGIEAYFDALVLRDHGRNLNHTRLLGISNIYLFDGSPNNPFDNTVQVTFPVSLQTAQTIQRNSFENERFTGGLIASLPFEWKGTAEVTFGAARYSYDILDSYYNGPFFAYGNESPELNPFGNWDAFVAATGAYKNNLHYYWSSHNRYREQSIRLAGPVFHTAGGAATLTLLAERRGETVPRYDETYYTDAFGGPETDLSSVAARSRKTASLYAELRAPLVGDAAAFPLLRRLELQLAVRYDRVGVDFSASPSGPDATDVLHARFAGVTYTAGAKLSPLPWMMLRGSYATGRESPPLNYLIGGEATLSSITDPKRDGDTGGEDYIFKYGGSPDLGMVRANTLSLGLVLNPMGDGGPRLSLDYSRIHRTHDPFLPTQELILAHEDLWPDRVTRAPLTAEDIALGYTGGKLLVIDTRAMNAGGLLVETLDAKLDWNAPFLSGRLHIYGAATVQLRNALQAPFASDLERVGFFSSPLRWRANGGMEWATGAASLGANVQFFSHYRNYRPEYQSISDMNRELQGSAWVKSQAYLDLSAGYRFRLGGPGRGRTVSLDFGIVNVLDQQAPYEADINFRGPQFSLYGDPRGRRFELTLNASF